MFTLHWRTQGNASIKFLMGSKKYPGALWLGLGAPFRKAGSATKRLQAFADCFSLCETMQVENTDYFTVETRLQKAILK